MMIRENTICFDKKLAKLPWNEKEVYSTGNIKNVIAGNISEDTRYFLPDSITLLFDKETGAGAITDFIGEATDYLNIEFRHREKRKQRFIEAGLLSNKEFQHIIVHHNAIQPWILYYSKQGGLGEYDEKNNSVLHGMIPCSSMTNHGVTWQNLDDEFKMWLITSRKKNAEWDWDSDFGHESGHACFAPIPLFVQSLHLQQGESSELNHVNSIYDLTPDHIARICYMLTEIAVIAVRGERRETISGLPVAENPDEFRAFLDLSDRLMPGLGFLNALKRYDKSESKFVDVNEGDMIFHIGVACLKGLYKIKNNFNSYKIPSIDMFPFPRRN